MTDTGSQIPQDQPAMERGLLDLSVALSTRNITAGKQFAIFVLVKNPFDKPVWVRQVHVSLPSELKLAGTEDIKRQKRNEKTEDIKRQKRNEKDDNKNNFQGEKDEQIVRLETKLEVLNLEFGKILDNINNKESLDVNTKNFLNSVETKVQQIQLELKNLTGGRQANIHIGDGSSIGDLKVNSNQLGDQANIHIGDGSSIGDLKVNSSQPNMNIGDGVSIGSVEIYNPNSFLNLNVQGGKVDLESSLPNNVALQPGSTVVYTAILYVERSLVFTPSQYRLQFNVNYSFHRKLKPISNEQNETGEEGIFTNTVAYELSIRPSVSSVIIGAGIGGFTGAIARLLQITPTEKWQIFSSTDIVTFLITIVVTVILSGIAVVFMVRKSEAQSFVSVEDFWGGLLIGFLVGYTGTSFFEQLTGITNPTLNVPSPKMPPRP
jgi:hypothetical protein